LKLFEQQDALVQLEVKANETALSGYKARFTFDSMKAFRTWQRSEAAQELMKHLRRAETEREMNAQLTLRQRRGSPDDND
jgi:hypothetical protein